MKVVLFCGGFGMRMRGGDADAVPKPMQMVGPQPLLWHVMRYYAHFGHRDFVLCLGYGAESIKEFFLDYHETCANDFVLRNGEVELLSSDISDWTITFADTGLSSGLGDRLLGARRYLEDDEMFMANYADVLCDANLDDYLKVFDSLPTMVGSMLAVRPQASFHLLDIDASHAVRGVRSVADTPMRENGGYLMLRREIFDYLRPGEDIVGDAFPRLIEEGRLMAFPHDGFWRPADTFKERA